MAKRRTRKKVNTFKFKITKELVIFLTCLIALIAVAIVLSIPTDKENIYTDYSAAATSLSTDDETITTIDSDEHVFETISYKDLIEKIDDESGIFYVYYSSTDVSDAVSLMPSLNSYAELYDVDTIYLLDNSIYTELDTTVGDDVATIENYEAELSIGSSADDKVLLNVTPGLFIYNDHKLIFNSGNASFVTDDNQAKYTWNVVLNRAFAINEDIDYSIED